MDKLNPNLLKKYEVVYELSKRGFINVDDTTVPEFRIILRKLLLENKPFQSIFDKNLWKILNSIRERTQSIKEPNEVPTNTFTKKNFDNAYIPGEQHTGIQAEAIIKADYLSQWLKLEAKMEQFITKLLKATSSSFGRECTRLNLLPSGSSLKSDDYQIEDGVEELNSPVAAITSRSAQMIFSSSSYSVRKIPIWIISNLAIRGILIVSYSFVNDLKVVNNSFSFINADQWLWKPRQIDSKTSTFEMIEEKKILTIEYMWENEVYLGWESVSEVWSLELILSYRLSYSFEIQFNKKMWILYAEQHWTKAIDLKSAVERLYEKLGSLEFDADHEAIYWIERYYMVQQCKKVRDVFSMSLDLWKPISEIRLRHFLDTINQYIRDCSDSDTSSSDEKESKAVEQNGTASETTEEE
ncbi:hypothetical protein FQA39_LY08779 [Lamprigera yunnana]|nr:hypothetical protein FQA39_LY08779 [Lamprigera yunnana]